VTGAPRVRAATVVTLIGLMLAVVGLQAVHERQPAATTEVTQELLYVRSPDTMRRLALSYDMLLADMYWIRAVQHYGGTRLSSSQERRFQLLYPLLDLTTSLDPRMDVAYYFGSIFLSEKPPGGPGRPDLAIALLEKGLREQPDKWEFARWIGFVHYWWRNDYVAAADWFTRAANFPNAPFWMAPLAATTLAEGGNRHSSRLLWQEFARSAPTEALGNEARRRLQQLDAMDQMDSLRQMVSHYRERRGDIPQTWEDLGRAGYLRGIPVDPLGTPYRLTSGEVMLGHGSRLGPLPAEPQRLLR
jgi:hypothetical protein